MQLGYLDHVSRMLLVRFDASFSPRYGTTQPVLGWTCKHHRELGFADEMCGAGYGSRGDVEPCIATARELARRGHDVRMAVTVPPDMVAAVHGGAGTTATGLRAGVPSLALWVGLDQQLWAGAIERLKVGAAHHFTATNQESLVADLRSILSPQCVTRARDVAASMAKSAESVASAADLLEDVARASALPA
jgi:UDP:flavonoid glycosyltransferase YjiC (YdhE family)